MATSYLITVAWMWAMATISPGPNFLTIAQIAASKSRAAAVAAIGGTGVATVIWGVCGVAGVHALFIAAPWAYLVLKIGGAAYLVYSGGRMMVPSFRRTNIGKPADNTTKISRTSAFTIGMATGLANPRSALSVASVFAVALPGPPTLGIAAAAVATMVIVSISWYLLVAYVFTSEPLTRGYRQIGRWIDRVAGGLLVLAGSKLAMESK